MHFKTGENTRVVLALQKVDVRVHFDGNVRTQRNQQQRRALGYTTVINTMKDNFRVPPEMMPVFSVSREAGHKLPPTFCPVDLFHQPQATLFLSKNKNEKEKIC